MKARPMSDIANSVLVELGDNGELLIDTKSISANNVSTHDGEKFNMGQLFQVDTANPLYVLFENPAGSGVTVELIKRYFQTETDGAKIYILWDYDVSNATKTSLTVFNENNIYRGVKDAKMEVSALNPITIGADGIASVTGAATIDGEGIIREPGFIASSGAGNNTSGDINTEVGTRIYAEGTGFLVKIVSDGNSNLTLLGYTHAEHEN